MRVFGWIAAALVLSLTTPVLAQEDWDNFKFPEDGFEVNFPGKPKVENITWVSQYRYNLPAKLFSANHGKEQYTVTVVDYRPVLKLGEAAATMARSPGAMQLRTLQTMAEISAERNSTIIFPIPVEILDMFRRGGDEGNGAGPAR